MGKKQEKKQVRDKRGAMKLDSGVSGLKRRKGKDGKRRGERLENGEGKE